MMARATLAVMCVWSVAIALPTTKPKPAWPADLPAEWNWCDEGYCSPIKTQCGGSCINNAHMATIESRVALKLWGHPASRKTKPPPTTTFSLQPYDVCHGVSNFSAKSLPDWLHKYGLYDEATWPAGGACKICNDKVAQCQTPSCALEALKSSCGSKDYKKAVANEDPCLCASLSGSIGAGRSLKDLQQECRSNLVARKFEPCSCERMMQDRRLKPKYTPQQVAEFGSAIFDYDTWAPIKSNSTTPETHDAGYARSLYVRGPSMAHTHVHVHDWFEDPAKVKVRCDTTSGHMVTLVGWNRTATQPYWILRNSWSNVSTATNEGFMYIAMDCNCPGSSGLCEDLN